MSDFLCSGGLFVNAQLKDFHFTVRKTDFDRTSNKVSAIPLPPTKKMFRIGKTQTTSLRSMFLF
jgi:hypothetical protein